MTEDPNNPYENPHPRTVPLNLTCSFQVGDRIHQLTLMTSLNLMVPDDHYPHATVTEITPEGFVYEYDYPIPHGRAEWGQMCTGGTCFSEGFAHWSKVAT